MLVNKKGVIVQHDKCKTAFCKKDIIAYLTRTCLRTYLNDVSASHALLSSLLCVACAALRLKILLKFLKVILQFAGSEKMVWSRLLSKLSSRYMIDKGNTFNGCRSVLLRSVQQTNYHCFFNRNVLSLALLDIFKERKKQISVTLNHDGDFRISETKSR